MKKLPDYLINLSPIELANTQMQLDATVQDILDKGIKRKNAYGTKGELIEKKTMLRTAIDLKEAEAYMAIRGEARSQYVMMGDEKVMLTNEETRKAYARTFAKDEYEQLARVEAELAKLDVDIWKTKDEWEMAVKSAESIQVKAKIQAALLNFLAGGE